MEQTTKVVMVGNKKSVGVAVLLALLFGPLGLLYCSVAGGLILFVLGLLLFFVLPLVGPILIWVASMIWAGVSASKS